MHIATAETLRIIQTQIWADLYKQPSSSCFRRWHLLWLLLLLDTNNFTPTQTTETVVTMNQMTNRETSRPHRAIFGNLWKVPSFRFRLVRKLTDVGQGWSLLIPSFKLISGRDMTANDGLCDVDINQRHWFRPLSVKRNVIYCCRNVERNGKMDATYFPAADRGHARGRRIGYVTF